MVSSPTRSRASVDQCTPSSVAGTTSASRAWRRRASRQRATKTVVVEVYKGGRRVTSHAREHGRRRYITDPAHMPPSHRAHLNGCPAAW